MFGLGTGEIILILVIALIFIGPKKLPEIARALGKGLAEFKRATNDIKRSLYVDDYPGEKSFKDQVIEKIVPPDEKSDQELKGEVIEEEFAKDLKPENNEGDLKKEVADLTGSNHKDEK
jgi:TatA/E family protein of Tat protein translocase